MKIAKQGIQNSAKKRHAHAKLVCMVSTHGSCQPLSMGQWEATFFNDRTAKTRFNNKGVVSAAQEENGKEHEPEVDYREVSKPRRGSIDRRIVGGRALNNK